MRHLSTACLVGALALTQAGCAQIVLGVILATDGGGGGGGGGGSGSTGGGGTASFSVAVSPGQGPAGGGTLFQIAATTPGVSFGSTPQVLVGGAPATDVRVIDAQTLEAQSPANPQGNRSGPGTVEVRIAGFVSTNASWQWQAVAPTATGISPATGPTGGGTQVSISGTGFVAGMRVELAGVPATGVSVSGGTLLSALVPPGSAGVATVVVFHPEGQSAVVPGGFTYVVGPPAPPPPQVGELSFGLVSATGNSYHEVSLVNGVLGMPQKLLDLPAGTAPQGLIAENGERVATIDRNGQQLLRLHRFQGNPSTLALDANQDAERRGFARLFRKGDLQAVMVGMGLHDLNPEQGQTFLFGTLNGAARVEALAFSPWEEVFLAGSAADDDQSELLYTMGESEVGNLIPIGPFGTDIDALTWAADGLYGLRSPVGQTAMLYRIDVRTGAATLVGDTGVMGVTGFCEVPAYIGGIAGGPWIRAALPDTVVSGTTTRIVLIGNDWGGEMPASETPGASVRAFGFEQGSNPLDPGPLRLPRGFIDLHTPPRLTGAQVVLRVGTTRFRIKVIDGTQPLTVASGQILRLAGPVRVPQLTIAAGGALQGVGVEPLQLFCDGPIQIDGTLDASGRVGGRPRRAMGTGNIFTPGSLIHTCGDGGDGGPGAGGGGGGGAEIVSNPASTATRGGDGGWGKSGGGGGGGSPNRHSGRGGLGREPGAQLGTLGAGPSQGGDGAGGIAGGRGGFGGGGGGSALGEDRRGSGALPPNGGPGGALSGQSSAVSGGGGGGQQSSDGTGGGGGGHATAGENGRLSGGSATGGGPGGLPYGGHDVLSGGAGGGGGSGRGGFNGLAQGGSGGGGAVVIASRTRIAVSATGVVLANGGIGARLLIADGEGGAGAGGSLWFQAPEVEVATGARIEAKGGARAPDSGNYRGAGGDGRVRVDSPLLRIDGVAVSEATFAGVSTPAVGLFGTVVPMAAFGPQVPGASTNRVDFQYNVTDGDHNTVFVDVEYSATPGPGFLPATLLPTGDFRVFAVMTDTPQIYSWDARADLPPGTYTVVLRIRGVDARVGNFANSAPFTLVVN